MKVFPGINVTSNAPRPRFVARPGNRDRVKHRIKTEGERERERGGRGTGERRAPPRSVIFNSSSLLARLDGGATGRNWR